MTIFSAHPDGNCALNATVIAATDAIVAGKLDNNPDAQQKWLKLLKDAKLIQDNTTWSALKSFLSQQISYKAQLNLQLKLAPHLRTLYVTLAQHSHKNGYLERTTGAFIGAFYSYVDAKLNKKNNPDDIYSVSSDIREYFEAIFKEFNITSSLSTEIRNKINQRLGEDWKGYLFIIFLDYLAKDGIWMGDLELGLLLPHLGFNFYLKNVDHSTTKYTDEPNKPALVFLHRHFHWFCETDRTSQDNIPERSVELIEKENFSRFWEACLKMAENFNNGQNNSSLTSNFNEALIAFLHYKRNNPEMMSFEFANMMAALNHLAGQPLTKGFQAKLLLARSIELFDFYQTYRTDKNPTYPEFMQCMLDENTTHGQIITECHKFIANSKIARDNEKGDIFLYGIATALRQKKQALSIQDCWDACAAATQYYMSTKFTKDRQNASTDDIINHILMYIGAYVTNIEYQNALKLHLHFLAKTLPLNTDSSTFINAMKRYSTFPSPLFGAHIDANSLPALFSLTGQLLFADKYIEYVDTYLQQQELFYGNRFTVSEKADVLITIWEMTVQSVPSLQNWTTAMQFAQKVIFEQSKLPANMKNTFLSLCQDRLFYSPLLSVKPDTLQRCWNAGAVSLLASLESAKNKESKPPQEKAWQIASQYFSDKELEKSAKTQFEFIYTQSKDFSELCQNIRNHKFTNSATFTQTVNTANTQPNTQPTITPTLQQ